MERNTRTLAMLAAVVFATVAGGGLAVAGGTGDAGGIGNATNPGSVAAQADCSFPVTKTDVTGTQVTLEDRPDRIVTLQPSDAQIVWAMNASDRVVGMPQGSTTAYLNGTANVTDVKNEDGSVDLETVTNLEPDLVIAANVTRAGTVRKLRDAGITVYHFGQVSSMAETYRNINTTGRLIGTCGAATDTVDSMRTRLDRIRQAVADEEEPRVLYTFYGFAAGNNTHLHSMIEMAGGENIADNKTGYYEISTEVVAARDPQWIVQPSTVPTSPPKGAAYNSTTAVEQDQVLIVNANYANQAGPRIVTVVEKMAKTFHPEAFDESGDPIVENGTQTTDGSGPGFAPVAALVALLGTALALGFRRKGV